MYICCIHLAYLAFGILFCYSFLLSRLALREPAACFLYSLYLAICHFILLFVGNIYYFLPMLYMPIGHLAFRSLTNSCFSYCYILSLFYAINISVRICISPSASWTLSVRPKGPFCYSWVGELTLGSIFVLLVYVVFSFWFDLHLRTFYLCWLDFSLGHSP